MTVTAITLTITMTALNTAAIEYTMGNTFAVGLAGEKITLNLEKVFHYRNVQFKITSSIFRKTMCVHGS